MSLVQIKTPKPRQVKTISTAVVAILALIMALSAYLDRNGDFEKVVVTRHVDGDTVYVTDARGSEHRVRFIGVDGPETRHPSRGEEPYGREASAFTESMLLGRTVYLEKDVSNSDRYGRLLRYIWLEKPRKQTEQEISIKMFNAILLLEGFAQVATFPPDVKYVDYFVAFQAKAVEENKGLWGLQDARAGGAPSAPAAAGLPADGHVFVGSNNSDKYHKPDCALAKRISAGNLRGFGSVQEAAGQDYTPCGVCKP